MLKFRASGRGATPGHPRKFRYNAAGAIAALIALIAAVPIAGTSWYLAPILLIPLAIAAGVWRAGTDVTANGLRVRALFGSRFVPWTKVANLVVAERNRVYAETEAGTSIRLPAVFARDLPKVVAASGQPLSS